MPRLAAYTLLELIVVLTLGLVGFYLAATALGKTTESAAIGTAAQTISDCLADAQQEALSQNVPVEVRLYATSAAGYQALQLHHADANGTMEAAGSIITLPDAVVIDATPVHSSLVTTNAATPAPDPSDPRLNALTRCFHFLPGGATDLAPGTQWTLTVRGAPHADPAHFPANWACITLDPLTGRAQIYRP